MAILKEKPAEPVRGCIVGTSAVRLWGLSSRERLRRQLIRAGITLIDEADDGVDDGSVVCLRGDFLFDDRVVNDLAQASSVVLQERGTAVAAHVPAALLDAARHRLANGSAAPWPAGLRTTTAATLSSAYDQTLLKAEPPRVLALRLDQQSRLERHLFEGAYKGVTDLVTKWVWPAPARLVTRLCAERGIAPNVVTSISFALVLVVLFLFAQGSYVGGLALAWIMTFLDTVDGKLARVTLTSTPFGHVFDHAIDIVHPPFWYIAWGIGLGSVGLPVDLGPVIGAILAGYVAGRLVEGAFNYWLADFSMFCWRPADSYFRLVMARRNPNLLLLTAGVLLSRPDWGLLAVAVWTVLSAIILLARLGLAVRARAASGPLRSWLEDPSAETLRRSALARPFLPTARDELPS